MSRYPLSVHTGSTEENSNLAILPGASVIGLDLENHAKPPQPIVPVDYSICSPGALRSVFEPKGYWFLVVPGENSLQGGATSEPTIVLLPFSWEGLLERLLDLVGPSSPRYWKDSLCSVTCAWTWRGWRSSARAGKLHLPRRNLRRSAS